MLTPRKSVCLKYFFALLFAFSIGVLQFPIKAAISRQKMQSDENPHQLKPGETYQQDIKGNEAHKFKVHLSANQYARFELERHDIWLQVRVSASDGRTSITYENPAGPESSIFASLYTSTDGDCLIEVSPTERTAPVGHYVIRIGEARLIEPADEQRIKAERWTAEGRRLQVVPESRRAALNEYEKAVPVWEQLGDKFELANTLHSIAQTYKALGRDEFDKSVSYYKRVLELREGDTQGGAYTLLDLAAAHRDFGNPGDELAIYEKVLPLFEASKNRRGQAITLYRIGLHYARQRQMARALEYYKSALAINHSEGDRSEEIRTLNAIGGAYDLLLQPTLAIEYYSQAIKGWESIGNLAQKGNTLNNIGKILDDSGEWQQALEHYNQALNLFAESEAGGDRLAGSMKRAKAITLQNLGNLYTRLGELDTALNYLQEALSLREETGGRGNTLMQIGYAYALSGEAQKALDYCNQALPLQTAANEVARAETLTVMGMANDALNKHELALEKYKSALQLRQDPRGPDPQAQAITLTNMGRAYLSLKQYNDAIKSFEQAREIYHRFGERNGESIALFGMARVERDRGKTEAALKQVEEALALIEPLRSNITSRQLRASYFAINIDRYELYIDLKMQSGEQFYAAAFEASERSRARALLDLLSEARIDIVPSGDPELSRLVDARHQILNNLKLQLRRKSQMLAENKSAGEIAAIQREMDKLTADSDRNETEIRSRNPRYAELMFPQPLGASEIRKLLDRGTVMLEFFLGEERSFVWALTTEKLTGYELPPGAQIEAAASKLRSLFSQGRKLANETDAEYRARLSKVETEYWREASTLSHMLLGPVADQLKDKTLLIVPDGELMYLPFGALPAPDAVGDRIGQPLTQEHIVVNLPSGSVLAALRQNARRPAASRQVAVFADPVFERDDPRIYDATSKGAAPPASSKELAKSVRDTDGDDNKDPRLPRLPFTNDEARYILSFASPLSMKAIGFQATRKNVMALGQRHYRIIHFATHGLLNEKHPESSGLVLSLYDERGQYHPEAFLRLSDIYGMSLPADLIVLSACRTGLGKAIRGEGLIGLTRGFMHAGTSRVVASLWKVDDEATAELMKIFYHKMLKDGMSPAAALRVAQLSLAKEERWSHPYFWAGFVLQGEWR